MYKTREEQILADQKLVAVLSNPPSVTSGNRTRGRVDQARAALRLDSCEISNLFSLSTYRTGDISSLGAEEEPWLIARQSLLRSLCVADAIILGYGLTEPTGPARAFHRSQVSWLMNEIKTLSVPAYVVGDGPRHPSRWQRFTSRVHGSMPFEQALARSLCRLSV